LALIAGAVADPGSADQGLVLEHLPLGAGISLIPGFCRPDPRAEPRRRVRFLAGLSRGSGGLLFTRRAVAAGLSWRLSQTPAGQMLMRVGRRWVSARRPAISSTACASDAVADFLDV